MSHWLDKVLELLRHETSDLRVLAKVAGADVRTFYRGIKLDGVDICGQDVRGIEFDAEELAKVHFDHSTRLDESQRIVLTEQIFADYGADFGRQLALDIDNQASIPELLRLGSRLTQSGRHMDAVDLYRRAVGLFPTNFDLRSRLSNALYRTHNYTESKYLLAQLVQERPNNAAIFVQLIRSIEKAEPRDSKEAVNLSFEAMDAFPTNERLLNFVIGLFNRTEEWDGATAALSKLTSRFPDRADYWSLLGLALYKRGRADEGVDAHFRALELEPGRGSSWRRFLDSETLHPKEIFSAFRRSYRLNPIEASNLETVRLVARQLSKLQKHSLAREVYGLAVEARPDSLTLWRGYAESFRLEGNLRKAFAIFREVAKRFPKSALPIVWHARALHDSARTKDGIALLRNALKEFPRSGLIWMEIIDIQLKSGNPQLAGQSIKDFRRAVPSGRLPLRWLRRYDEAVRKTSAGGPDAR